MESSSKGFGEATRAAGLLAYGSPLHEDCALAQAARMNLLLIHVDEVTQNFLELWLLDGREPIGVWRPGERLVLPPVARAGTMILHDVDALTLEDQYRLLDWLEQTVGQTQVVSTTAAPLLPCVAAGAFIETLYYRLNMVCVDVAA
jgi:hypothetical protein